MPQDFLNPRTAIAMHGRDLPHWQQDVVLQFVTFRLKDSLPQSKLREWTAERTAWLACHPKPWDAKTRQVYNERFIASFEAWLDRGLGSCILKDPAVRQKLEAVFEHDSGTRVEFISRVIMPNHVHLLFRPLFPLPDLIRNWKSFSARGIGRGPLWQRNYRDTLIRNERHLAAVVRYIRRNPKHLPSSHTTLWESDRARRIL
jgi:type I restriction enzyme R subunit